MEEFEDAINADEDIFAEPVPQNRLKYLSEYDSSDFLAILIDIFVRPQLKITQKVKGPGIHIRDL